MRKPTPIKHCAACGAQMQRKRFGRTLEDLATFNRRKYCDRTCMAKGMVRPGTEGNLQRIYKQRKTGCCEHCGTSSNLGVHHRDRDRTNNSPENLQTLCASCHTALHWKEGKTLPSSHPRFCTVCGKPSARLGFCNTHLTRFKRHGSPYLVKRKIGHSWQLVEETGILNGPASLA